jgi:hypothetical protein
LETVLIDYTYAQADFGEASWKIYAELGRLATACKEAETLRIRT